MGRSISDWNKTAQRVAKTFLPPLAMWSENGCLAFIAKASQLIAKALDIDFFFLILVYLRQDSLYSPDYLGTYSVGQVGLCFSARIKGLCHLPPDCGPTS